MDKKKAETMHSIQAQTEYSIPSEIYPVIDNDLARDNVENDLPAADLQELHINHMYSGKTTAGLKSGAQDISHGGT